MLLILSFNKFSNTKHGNIHIFLHIKVVNELMCTLQADEFKEKEKSNVKIDKYKLKQIRQKRILRSFASSALLKSSFRFILLCASIPGYYRRYQHHEAGFSEFRYLNPHP